MTVIILLLTPVVVLAAIRAVQIAAKAPQAFKRYQQAIARAEEARSRFGRRAEEMVEMEFARATTDGERRFWRTVLLRLERSSSIDASPHGLQGGATNPARAGPQRPSA